MISCLTEGLGIGLVKLGLRVWLFFSLLHSHYMLKKIQLQCGKSHNDGDYNTQVLVYLFIYKLCHNHANGREVTQSLSP